MSQLFEDTAATYSRLFLYFAAFEHALKNANYLYDQNTPRVDWPTFARDVGDVFFDAVETEPSVQRLIDTPPRKFRAEEIRQGARALREEAVPEVINSTQSLIEAVKTARNNLLHGDKFGENPNRDVEVTEAGLVVLALLKNWLLEIPELQNIGWDVHEVETSFPLAFRLEVGE